MTEVLITKLASAKRLIDAAVRLLFGQGDILAVHTIAAAALGVLEDLTIQRNPERLEDLYVGAMRHVYQQLGQQNPSDHEIHKGLPSFKAVVRNTRNRPANFLKHADHDSKTLLSEDSLRTDDLLLQACVFYLELGHPFTPEMEAFSQWHLSVYPNEESDKLQTDNGYFDELPRETQLQMGNLYLKQTLDAG